MLERKPLPNIRNTQVRYMQPVLEALRALGGAAKRREVHNWIADNYEIPENEIDKILDQGVSRFAKNVDWARHSLSRSGMLRSGKRGIWTLTEKGHEVHLSNEDAYRIYKKDSVKNSRSDKITKKKMPHPPIEDDDTTSEEIALPDGSDFLNEDEIRGDLIELLRKMTPTGFERFCAHLLLHIGFEDVQVSSPTKDGGVDGEAFLPINRFIRTKVMFQCKRYEGTVGSDKILQFRGAFAGHTERGIFLTTGTFTRDAQKEAAREGKDPVELVDIDDLLKLMIDEKLGVEEVKALRIKPEIFDPYMPKE